MARRRIGQEHLRLGCGEASRTGSLEALRGLIDWAAIDRHLAPIYASARESRPGHRCLSSGLSSWRSGTTSLT